MIDLINTVTHQSYQQSLPGHFSQQLDQRADAVVLCLQQHSPGTDPGLQVDLPRPQEVQNVVEQLAVAVYEVAAIAQRSLSRNTVQTSNL